MDESIFYKEDVNFISVKFIYISINNEIIKINENKHILSEPNLLTKDQLIYLIKNNRIIDSIKYSLFSILKYNFSIEPENLKYFLEEDIENNKKYFSLVKEISSIYFNETISLFQDMNELVILFHERKHIKTRKNPLSSINKKTKRNNLNIRFDNTISKNDSAN